MCWKCDALAPECASCHDGAFEWLCEAGRTRHVTYKDRISLRSFLLELADGQPGRRPARPPEPAAEVKPGRLVLVKPGRTPPNPRTSLPSVLYPNFAPFLTRARHVLQTSLSLPRRPEPRPSSGATSRTRSRMHLRYSSSRSSLGSSLPSIPPPSPRT